MERMNRLLKRHKRQVARAKEKVRLSEPDVRTPEQLLAAREASQPAGGWGKSPHLNYIKPGARNEADRAADGMAKADGGS
jgi:hypothetical protein